MKKLLAIILSIVTFAVMFTACKNAENIEKTGNENQTETSNSTKETPLERDIYGTWNSISGDYHTLKISENGTLSISDGNENITENYNVISKKRFSITFDDGGTEILVEYEYDGGTIYRYQDGEKDGYKYHKQKSNTSSKPNVTVEGCRFTDEVRAIDGECATVTYPQKDGKVYIDTVIFITNADTKMSDDNIKGYVTYDSQRYDLQYCAESYTSVSVDEEHISVGESGRVHLFTAVPEEAENGEELTVHFSVDGEDYNCTVDAKDSADALSKKKELKIGDKETLLDGALEFEVIDCKYTKFLQATDYANSEQYTGTTPFVDCIIKITNNTGISITDIFGYVKLGDEIVRGAVKIETENNTKLEFLQDIEPNKTEYIHIYASVEENTSKNDLAIRFNLGGNCYYCNANQ